MIINGGECSITIKSAGREYGIPYAIETLREAVTLLREEAGIEGDGICRAIRGRRAGVTGCVVTPLTMGASPLLLALALGCSGLPRYVSETRSLYRSLLRLAPMEDSTRFDVIQFRGGSRKLYEACVVSGFELRIVRGETVHLKLELCGEIGAAVYPYEEVVPVKRGERFMGDGVSYRINGAEYRNIYGLTLEVKKAGGTAAVLYIKRVVEAGEDIPGDIEELVITAKLFCEKYEYRYCGMFRLTLNNLILAADGTEAGSADAVIGSLRYYCAGAVQGEVFTNEELKMKNGEMKKMRNEEGEMRN
jgi:hypothetical protein